MVFYKGKRVREVTYSGMLCDGTKNHINFIGCCSTKGRGKVTDTLGWDKKPYSDSPEHAAPNWGVIVDKWKLLRGLLRLRWVGFGGFD